MLEALSPFVSPLVYIATMLPADDEARERIARHRASRAHKGFSTIELYTGLSSAVIPEGCAVLLECLGNLVANEMFSPGGAGAATRDAVLRGLDVVSRRATRVVVVTNDIISDGVDYPSETENYRRTLAGLNRAIARQSAVVAETVCGIPLWYKRDKAWDE